MTDEVEYMTADVEDRLLSSRRRTSRSTRNGMFVNKRVTCRHRDEIIEVERERVDYIDVSPKYGGFRRDRVHPVP